LSYDETRFDVGVTNVFVFDMLIGTGLEFMAIVGPDFFDPELGLLDYEVDKIDGIRLRMTLIDLQAPLNRT